MLKLKWGVIGFSIGLSAGGAMAVMPHQSFSQGEAKSAVKSDKPQSGEPQVRRWDSKDYARLYDQLNAERDLDLAEYHYLQVAYLHHEREDRTGVKSKYDPKIDLTRERARVAEFKSVDLYPNFEKDLKRGSTAELRKMANALLVSISENATRAELLMEKHGDAIQAAKARENLKLLSSESIMLGDSGSPLPDSSAVRKFYEKVLPINRADSLKSKVAKPVSAEQGNH